MNRRQAVARIANAWVETAHPTAYKKLCEEFAVVQARNEFGTKLPSSWLITMMKMARRPGRWQRKLFAASYEEGIEPLPSYSGYQCEAQSQAAFKNGKVGCEKIGERTAGLHRWVSSEHFGLSCIKSSMISVSGLAADWSHSRAGSPISRPHHRRSCRKFSPILTSTDMLLRTRRSGGTEPRDDNRRVLA